MTIVQEMLDRAIERKCQEAIQHKRDWVDDMLAELSVQYSLGEIMPWEVEVIEFPNQHKTQICVRGVPRYEYKLSFTDRNSTESSDHG